MTWRTPSSLKWLITKRSRLSGALLKIDDERMMLRDKIRSLDHRAGVLREQLAALDQTFGLYETPMEPTAIRPVRPNTHTHRSLLPHGKLSRIMFHELRLADGWLSTTGMLARVLGHLPEGDPFDPEVVRICIRKRLGALSRKGLIEQRNAGISAAGLRRFVRGDYAWAMQTGLMLTYQRANGRPLTDLTKRLHTTTHLGTRREAAMVASADALCAKKSQLALPLLTYRTVPAMVRSQHERPWTYTADNESPGDIDVWHVWNLPMPAGY